MICEVVMPIIGNLLFLPILAILINIFICTKGSGNDFDETILDKDCTTYCWKNDHIIYAIFSATFILIYLPLAVYFRPYW